MQRFQLCFVDDSFGTAIDIIIKLSPAFVSLVVGCFGVYIAFNQYRTAKDKLRLELFEKRIDAYEKLQEYFNCILRDGRVENQAMSTLAEARYRSHFLFGNEILELINEVWNKASEMRRFHLILYKSNPLPVGEERDRICEEESNLLQWNLDKQKELPNKYSKYLKFM
jgi:hypothetical protein